LQALGQMSKERRMRCSELMSKVLFFAELEYKYYFDSFHFLILCDLLEANTWEDRLLCT
jgi:hypothetical protein